MSRELSTTFGASYESSVDPGGSIDIGPLFITLTTAKWLKTNQTVGITQEALLLGDITAPGFLVLVNLDTTNYIEVKVATSGAIFAKLWPKDSESGISFCVVHLGSGAQAPFVIAHTASCELGIFLCSL